MKNKIYDKYLHNKQRGRTEKEVTNYEYLGQTIAMKSRARHEVSVKIKAGLGVFGKYKEIILDRHFHMSLKRASTSVSYQRWHMDSKHDLLQRD